MRKALIFGAAGFMIGGIAGYFIGKKVADDAWNSALAMEDEFDSDPPTDEPEREEEVQRVISGYAPSNAEKPEPVNGPIRKAMIHGIPKPDLAALSRKYNDPDFDEHLAERESPEDDAPNRPTFEIPKEAYMDGFEDSDDAELIYFEQDDILVNQEYDNVYASDDILTDDLLDKLRDLRDGDSIYVHCDDMDMNYQITMNRGRSYHREFFDVEEDD